MLAMSKHAFAINPNPNLKAIALAKGWTVYQPEITQSSTAAQKTLTP
jgi:phosphoserine phosphatase